MPRPARSFDALGDVVYVHCPAAASACDDAGTAGNLSKPHRTLNGGIGAAHSRGRHTVHVARRGAGVAYDSVINLVAGVNLRGGFESDFVASADPSRPTEVSSQGSPLVAGVGIDTPTTFENFTIEGSSINQPNTVGVYLVNATDALVLRHIDVTSGSADESSVGLMLLGLGATAVSGPLVEDSRFVAGDVDGRTGRSTGGWAENVSPTFRRCVFRSGAIDARMDVSPAPQRTLSRGLFLGRSAAVVEQCDITATAIFVSPGGLTLDDQSVLQTEGVEMEATGERLVNNLIRAGAAWWVRGVRVTSPSGPQQAPFFVHNTIIVEDDFSPASNPVPAQGLACQGPASIADNLIANLAATPSGAGIAINGGVLGRPVALYNNLIANFSVLYSDSGSYTTVLTMESHVSGQAIPVSGNLAAAVLSDVHFTAANDFSITSASPAFGAALDLAVSTDFTGAARSLPYSIGAFE